MAIEVRKIDQFNVGDLNDICQATSDAIEDGIGFNWISPPMPETLESYWKGVLVVPERILFCGWLDGTLAATIQLVKPPASKETSAFAAHIEAHFVAPWARGHGLAKFLLNSAEREAAMLGFTILRLSVRETQEAAIKLYQENGYIRWGILPYQEFVSGHMMAGHHFYKRIEALSSLE